VHFDDLSSPRETVLPLRDRSAAGHLIPAPLPRGYAARMFTGALMPDGADAVLMQEDRVAGDDAVRIRVGINLGANHRLAGEDVVAGETILLAGRRQGPPEIGLVASLRHAAVRVGRGLRCRPVLATGDEVAEPAAASWADRQQ
jgi:molybdopterin molybdotransferase